VRSGARSLAGIVLAGLLAGALSSCSTAPSAASVNGQSISEQQLDAQLEAWSSSPAFVQSENQTFAEEAAQAQSQGRSNVPTETVQGAGSGPGTYGMYWTTIELSDMITGLAVHQYLVDHGKAPSALQLAAAWASEYAESPTIWEQLPPQARAGAAYLDAEYALMTGRSGAASEATSFYKAREPYFWSQVCLTAVQVSVPGAHGSIDMGASKHQAEKLAGQLASRSSSPSVPANGGARYCDTPEQLIEQSPGFRDQVGALAPGQVTILAEPYGYQVVQVRSRTQIPLNAETAGAINVVAASGGVQVQLNGNTTVIDLLKKANVDVNPAYGTWDTSLPSPYPPQVLPPGASAG